MSKFTQELLMKFFYCCLCSMNVCPSHNEINTQFLPRLQRNAGSNGRILCRNSIHAGKGSFAKLANIMYCGTNPPVSAK